MKVTQEDSSPVEKPSASLQPALPRAAASGPQAQPPRNGWAGLFARAMTGRNILKGAQNRYTEQCKIYWRSVREGREKEERKKRREERNARYYCYEQGTGKSHPLEGGITAALVYMDFVQRPWVFLLRGYKPCWSMRR